LSSRAEVEAVTQEPVESDDIELGAGRLHPYRLAENRRRKVRAMSDGLVRPADIRQRPVVILLSASRGYSSLLFALLKSTSAFVALPGEHTHIYKLVGISRMLSAQSDDAVRHISSRKVEAFWQNLEWELGEDVRGPDATFLSLRVAHQLYTQWLDLPDPEDLIPLLEQVIGSMSGIDTQDDSRKFLRIVSSLRSSGIAIDPWYYDIPSQAVRDYFPDVPIPSGPPELLTPVEEPPFVVPVLGRSRPTSKSEKRPLLMKASVDAYRVSLLHQLFGERSTFVHLTRNPAASVSGLVDGWLSYKFYSHALPSGYLDIDGYTSTPAGTKGWWKFDAPPGWQAMKASSLLEVCAFQWVEAHRAILDATESVPTLRVMTEKIVAANDRTSPIRDILAMLSLKASGVRITTNPIVMASIPPALGRWRRRHEAIRRTLNMEAVLATAQSLGYDADWEYTWI
jgi:hypothetical protein